MVLLKPEASSLFDVNFSCEDLCPFSGPYKLILESLLAIYIYSLCMTQSLSSVWLFATLMDCSLQVLCMEFFRQEYIPFSRDLSARDQTQSLTISLVVLSSVWPPEPYVHLVYSLHNTQNNLLWVMLYRIKYTTGYVNFANRSGTS